MHAVERSMFLVIARLMWAFDIRRATDDDGNKIVPDQDDLVGGFLMQPRRFPPTRDHTAERISGIQGARSLG